MPPQRRVPGRPQSPYIELQIFDPRHGVLTDTLGNTSQALSKDIATGHYPYLEEQVDALLRATRIEPGLAEAMRSTDNDQFRTGWPRVDEDILRHSNFGRAHEVRRFAEEFVFMDRPDSRFATMRGAENTPLRVLRAVDWEVGNAELATRMHRRRFEGLSGSHVFPSLLLSHAMTYAPEIDAEPITIPYTRQDRDFITGLMGESAADRPIYQSELCQVLRARGLVDTSYERLESRVERSLQILDFELGYEVLMGVEDVWSSGGEVTATAERFFRLHRHNFLKAGLEAKVALAADFVQMCTDLVHREDELGNPEANRRLYLNALAVRLQGAIHDVRGLQRMFRTTYDSFGYPVPDILHNIPDAEPGADIAPAVGELVMRDVEVTATADPGEAQRINDRIADLNGRIAAADQPWIVAAKTRRTEGLGGAVSGLMKYVQEKGQSAGLFPASITRAELEQFVDLTYLLSQLGANPTRLAGAPTRLAERAQQEAKFNQERAGLIADGRPTPQLFTNLPVSATVNRLRLRWAQYRPVLFDVWPEAKASTMLRNLDALFASLPPIPDGE